MPRLAHRNPKYRKHRASGQAVVTIDGRDYYLGPYGTKASRNEYDRLIGEWLACGRRAPSSPAADLNVNEVCAAFWRHAEAYYRDPDGNPSGQLEAYRRVLRPLRRLYGETLATAFGPLALKALIGEMVRMGWCRNVINREISRVKHVFKWAVSEELVPATVLHALQAVQGLRRGRSQAKETEPVKPVPDEWVEAVRPLVSPHVRAMIDLQLITGMRSGEVCVIRGLDLDTTGALWVYKPSRHKSEHHGHERVVYLGPKAQEVLGPFLLPDMTAYLFSPTEAEKRRREAMHAARKTPLSCGDVPGSNRKRRPKRRPGDRYDVAAYRRAIARGCDKAFPPPEPVAKGRDESARQWRGRLTPDQRKELERWLSDHRWHPHQLRHNAATRLRRQFGLDIAQVILGHKTLTVTQVYAEKNVEAARRVMAEVG